MRSIAIHTGQPEALEFARQHSISTHADMRLMGPYARGGLLRLEAGGSVERQITDTGADYSFSQIDYLENDPDGGQRILASRMIATILGGKRTELAYWTQAAPTKQITIHQGNGNLAISNPADGSIDMFKLDPEVTPRVSLPSGRFYAFHAHPWTPEPLVVSGFYDMATPVDWEAMEIPFEPGQKTVEAPEGTIPVPAGFHDMFRRYGGQLTSV